jgi:hypothetical protein
MADESSGTRLLVEVLAWHAVKWPKVRQIRERGLPLIEVDASEAIALTPGAEAIPCRLAIVNGTRRSCASCEKRIASTVAGSEARRTAQARQCVKRQGKVLLGTPRSEALRGGREAEFDWSEVIAEARERATARIAAGDRSMTVARSVRTGEELDVRVTWRADGQVILRLMPCDGAQIARWEGTAEDMESVFRSELQTQAFEYLVGRKARVAADATFEVTDEYAICARREFPCLLRPRDDFDPRWDELVRVETKKILAGRGIHSP